MSLRIVTHCYAQSYSQYAIFLRYHLSSLLLYPSEWPVRVTVAYCTQDDSTCNVIDAFKKRGDLAIDLLPLSPKSLFRRSIGRNIAAQKSTEDLIWFCDVDHVFGPGCINALMETWFKFQFDSHEPTPVMMYPKEIQIHETHQIGDAIAYGGSLAVCKSTELEQIDLTQFVSKKYNRAIGGVQIVDGEFCRQHGYLNHSKKYQTDRKDGIPFGDFRDDIAFRHHCGLHGKIKAIDLPGIYRMRHSLTTYQGR